MTVTFDVINAQKISNFIVEKDRFEDIVKSKKFAKFDYVAIGYAKENIDKQNLENQLDDEQSQYVIEEKSQKVIELYAEYNIDIFQEKNFEKTSDILNKTSTITLPATKNGIWENLAQNILKLPFKEKSLEDYRKAGLELGRETVGKDSVYIPFVDALNDEQQISFFNGIMLSCYRQTRIAQTNPLKDPVVNVHISTENSQKVLENIEHARRISEATLLARTLECVPSNIKNPMWLAQTFKDLVDECENLDGELVFECLEFDQLKEKGFNAIVAVGQASATPPCMVTIKWIPNNIRENSPKIVLVGKGITYDTGGLSLKPREFMIPMKTDMSGSATVISAILSIAKAGLNVEVAAVATMAENAMGAASYRPGDVVKTYDGTTVEIVNTDAEGRMVLADGLGYAIKDLKADIVIDIATLTGAATVGLGRFHAATYSNDNNVWDKMFEASEKIGENVWRMPLPKDYREALQSPIADISHCEVDAHIGGGSVTAALFLEHFVKTTKWCHLDIAGVGRAGKPMGEVTTNQPTGFGAALLYGFVQEFDK